MKRAKETTFQVSLGKWILVCAAHASVSCRVHARLAALFPFLNIQEFRERTSEAICLGYIITLCLDSIGIISINLTNN